MAEGPVGVGIVGNLGGKALPAETLGGAGWCCLLVERVGTECAPLGGPAAMVPAESYKVPHGPWFVIAFIMAIRWHQETWSPWPV